MSIYSHIINKLDPESTGFQLRVDPNWRYRTATATLWQRPLPGRNPGGHHWYLLDRQEFDLPYPKGTTLEDVYGLMCEATMQVRLPGID